MFKRIFLDANVIADLFDNTRIFHEDSKEVLHSLVRNLECELFTSCDIITTLYYILSEKDKNKALEAILQINKLCSIVEFSNEEVLQSCTLMKKEKSFKDLEDTIQYVLAKKVNADLILSNDKGFVSTDIKLFSTTIFKKEYIS